jgi:hypothetical protein
VFFKLPVREIVLHVRSTVLYGVSVYLMQKLEHSVSGVKGNHVSTSSVPHEAQCVSTECLTTLKSVNCIFFIFLGERSVVLRWAACNCRTVSSSLVMRWHWLCLLCSSAI